MAIVMVKKTARVIGARLMRPDTRVLTLAVDEPLGFIGGQFVSVDTGEVGANGKPIRRAYSIFSSDAEQNRFELAVKRIDGGVTSRYMHELPVGAEVRFTGPWGELHPPAGASGPVLILATDTGITAALGLVRSARMVPLLERTSFMWLRTATDYFLPAPMVLALVPAACGEVRFTALPPIGHPERIAHVRGVLRARLARGPLAHGFISGDGAVNYALLDDLVAAGVPATRDSVESFFNMPRKAA